MTQPDQSRDLNKHIWSADQVPHGEPYEEPYEEHYLYVRIKVETEESEITSSLINDEFKFALLHNQGS